MTHGSFCVGSDCSLGPVDRIEDLHTRDHGSAWHLQRFKNSFSIFTAVITLLKQCRCRQGSVSRAPSHCRPLVGLGVVRINLLSRKRVSLRERWAQARHRHSIHESGSDANQRTQKFDGPLGLHRLGSLSAQSKAWRRLMWKSGST